MGATLLARPLGTTALRGWLGPRMGPRLGRQLGDGPRLGWPGLGSKLLA